MTTKTERHDFSGLSIMIRPGRGGCIFVELFTDDDVGTSDVYPLAAITGIAHAGSPDLLDFDGRRSSFQVRFANGQFATYSGATSEEAAAAIFGI
jgi:hypothetical protein